jgi:peptidoglycan hydrolase-like protein with peptidoglycan-binding domain
VKRNLRRFLPVLLAAVIVLAGFGFENATASATNAHPSYPGKLPSGCSSRTYGATRSNPNSACVRWIQQDVNFMNWAFGKSIRVSVDGQYGANTTKAVATFQASCNASLKRWGRTNGYMSGGEVGRNTWIALQTSCYQG